MTGEFRGLIDASDQVELKSFGAWMWTLKNINPLKDIGNLNPFEGTASVPDVSAAMSNAKNAALSVASHINSHAMNNPYYGWIQDNSQQGC